MDKETPTSAPAHATSTSNQNEKLLAALAYVGILWLVPLLAAKNSKFAMFHANQGLILFLVDVVITVLVWFVPFAWLFGWILWLLVLILAIVGIVNAVQGQTKRLPVIGGFDILK